MKREEENIKGKHHRRHSIDVVSINLVAYVFIGLFALICLLPFYLIIVASFTPETSLIRNGYPLFPTGEFSVESYGLCLKNPTEIVSAYATTIGVTLVGTLLAVLLATMTGYVLSRKDFPWRNRFSFFFFFFLFLCSTSSLHGFPVTFRQRKISKEIAKKVPKRLA